MEINENFYDVVIVGGGPAGLSAAIYMARAKYRVLVLEKAGIGGQITITEEIVNYPGVEKTSGKALTEGMRRQAESFGAEFVIAEVLNMELTGDVKVLHTTKGKYMALGVILATGANPRKLGFKGEKEFQGRGVAYCATCDGEFFTGLEVFVIGGGFAAVEEGLFLTKYAKKVTLIVREPDFTCARTVSDKLIGQDKISVVFETELIEVDGDSIVNYARFRDNRSGKEWVHEAGGDGFFGIFVFAGYVPNTDWIGPEVEKTPQGYIVTDRDQKTNLAGVYAAGDVCVKNLRQVVTAVSDGAAAATALEKDVSELHARLDIPDLTAGREAAVAKQAPESSGAGTGGDGGRGRGHRDSSGNRDRSGNRDSSGDGFLDSTILQQLQGVFAKFEQPVILRAWLDDSPLSGEMTGFLRELASASEMVRWEMASGGSNAGQSGSAGNGASGVPDILPAIEVCRADGSGSGVWFHGVPGGHEFNSFVIALYNVAGPGQPVEAETKRRLESIDKKLNLKVLVSLSCTMCPETVMSAQKAAAVSENIQAEMFDLAHFPALKEKYKVMSVPCMILNDDKVFFGKKGLEEITDILCEA